MWLYDYISQTRKTQNVRTYFGKESWKISDRSWRVSMQFCTFCISKLTPFGLLKLKYLSSIPRISFLFWLVCQLSSKLRMTYININMMTVLSPNIGWQFSNTFRWKLNLWSSGTGMNWIILLNATPEPALSLSREFHWSRSWLPIMNLISSSADGRLMMKI